MEKLIFINAKTTRKGLRGIFESGWEVTGEFIPIFQWCDDFTSNANLRNEKYCNRLIARFETSLFNGRLFNFFPDLNDNTHKVYLLEMGKNWRIPWEISLKGQKNSRFDRMSFIRVLKPNSLAVPISPLTELLRILVLQGSNGSSVTDHVDMNEESIILSQTVKQLPHEIKKYIDTVQVEPLNLSTLPDKIKDCLGLHECGSTGSRGYLSETN